MVFVLILAAISLAMTLAMLLMVSRGSFLSGQQKRFRTAVEAGRGGMEAMFQLISNRGNPSTPVHDAEPGGRPDQTGRSHRHLGRTGQRKHHRPRRRHELRYDGSTLGAYRVYTKIVDTVDGNSGADEGLIKTAVVNAGSGEVTVVSVPYLYTIEVLSQSTTNPTERSKLSILYQY